MGTTARILSSIAARAVARRRIVLAVAVLLGAGATVLAVRLHPSAAASTFVSSTSSQYRSTQRYYRSFGEEPIAVLVQGNLQDLVLTSDVNRLLGLEQCLSGRLPASELPQAGGSAGPCAALARARTVKVVLGPATFLSAAASQIDETLSRESAQAQAQASEARSVVERAARRRGYSAAAAAELGAQSAHVIIGRFQESVVTLALKYGLTARPSLDDPNFVSSVVFAAGKRAGTPKQRFAYLFPSRNAALVSVRMRAGLDEAQRNQTIALVRSAVALPAFQLEHGESYLVTGVPVIVSDLTGAITHSVELLMIAVALVMAGALGLLFRGRPRLLPLGLAVLATALTFGALALIGAPLTVAAVAVLPVLVGLAVDYAIQFQSRVGEEAERESGAAGGAIAAGAALGGPTILTAAAASAAAMLALLLSPVPMVRGFALLLIVGVAIALACTLVAGSAVLALLGGRPATATGAGAPRWPALHGRRRAGAPRPPGAGALAAALRGAGASLLAAWRGARELLVENPLTRLVVRTALVVAVRNPGRLLCVGLVLAALGWGLDTQTHVETDITRLVPQDLSSLRALQALERTTGVAGEVDLMVSGPRLTAPATIEWMSRYESRVLARYGYSSERGCGRARLCPAFSLPDLFSSPAGSAPAGTVTAAEVSGLLAAIPPYFSQDVISQDHRTATLAFGIRLMSLAEQQRLIEGMRAALRPPAGVSATLVGLPVLAAQSGSQVADPWRRLETLLVGLLAVASVLLVAFRGERRRALIPLVPVVLATGWSALILFAVRVPLNPMSVTLGALVIAISTEFSVLLAERHRQEVAGGLGSLAALRRAYARTGAAIAASGATATAGFGVLALSNIRMLRDFGLVTLIDLAVSLVGVLVSLPAVIVLAERVSGAPIRATLGRVPGARVRLGAAAMRLRRRAGERSAAAGPGHGGR